MQLFPELPPHVDPADPRTIAWQIERTQDVVTDHETRLQAVEAQPSIGGIIAARFPWGRLFSLLVPIGLFLIGLLSRDEAKRIGLKALGVLWSG